MVRSAWSGHRWRRKTSPEGGRRCRKEVPEEGRALPGPSKRWFRMNSFDLLLRTHARTHLRLLFPSFGISAPALLPALLALFSALISHLQHVFVADEVIVVRAAAQTREGSVARSYGELLRTAKLPRASFNGIGTAIHERKAVDTSAETTAAAATARVKRRARGETWRRGAFNADRRLARRRGVRDCATRRSRSRAVARRQRST